jgi:hypothetical protein
MGRTILACVVLIGLLLNKASLAQDFKTVPYFIRGQSKLLLLGRETVQRDLGLTKEQIEAVGKIVRPGGGVRITELDKQLDTFSKKALTESQLARLEEIYVQSHGAETLFNPTIATKLRLSDDQKDKLNEVRRSYMEEQRAWAKSLKELPKEDRE